MLLGEHDLCTPLEARDNGERRVGRGGIDQGAGQREHLRQAQAEGDTRRRVSPARPTNGRKFTL